MLKFCILTILFGVSTGKVLPAKITQNATSTGLKQRYTPETILSAKNTSEEESKSEEEDGRLRDIIHINIAASGDRNKVVMPRKKIIFYETGVRPKSRNVIDRRNIIKEKLLAEHKKSLSSTEAPHEVVDINISGDDTDLTKKSIIFHKIGINNAHRIKKDQTEEKIERANPVNPAREQPPPAPRFLHPGKGNNELLGIPVSKKTVKIPMVMTNKYKIRKRRSVFTKRKRGAKIRRNLLANQRALDIAMDMGSAERSLPADVQGNDRRRLLRELSRLNTMYDRMKSGASRFKLDSAVINEPTLTKPMDFPEAIECKPCADNSHLDRPCFIHRKRLTFKDIIISNKTQKRDVTTDKNNNSLNVGKDVTTIDDEFVKDVLNLNTTPINATTVKSIDDDIENALKDLLNTTTTKLSIEGENISSTTPVNDPSNITSENDLVTTTQKSNEGENIISTTPSNVLSEIENKVKELLSTSTTKQNNEDDQISSTTPTTDPSEKENFVTDLVITSTPQHDNAGDDIQSTTPKDDPNDIEIVTELDISSTTKDTENEKKRRNINFHIGKNIRRSFDSAEDYVSSSEESDEDEHISKLVGDTSNIQELVNRVKAAIHRRRNMEKKMTEEI